MRKTVPIFFLFILAFATVNAGRYCDSSYNYYDAARNKYVLTGNELQFIPVKASESSSGIYNGGSFVKLLLTIEERNELVRLFTSALAHKKSQTSKNFKPNAAIEFIGCKNKKSFLLKSTAEINIALNNYLKLLIKK